jgi:ferric-dicitrate binding protein FerR (iron transport regulator)
MDHDRHPLTEDEVEALRRLVPHVDQIKDDAEYAAARALVFRHWRGAILAAAGLVAASVVLWEHGRRVMQSVGKFLSGVS